MNAAAFFLLYAAALSWCAPPVLARISRGGVTPHLGVAAWLLAVGGVMAAWTAAVAILFIAATRNLAHGTPVSFCLSSLGIVGRIGLSRHLASITVIVLLSAALIATVVIAWRVATRVRRIRLHSREHATITTY